MSEVKINEVRFCKRCKKPITGRWKNCKVCRAKFRVYANKPEARARLKRWKELNSDKVLKARRDYVQRNAEEIKKNARDDWWADVEESRRIQREKYKKRKLESNKLKESQCKSVQSAKNLILK